MEEKYNEQLSDRDKAMKVFKALDDFINSPKFDENQPPMLRISQSWEVSCDYGGWRSDSDFVVNSAFVLKTIEEEGRQWDILDLDYILEKIPEIQKSLDESSEWCEEEYGEVTNHEEIIFEKETEIYQDLMQLMDNALDMPDIKDWILEVDTPVGDVYLVKREARSPSYGGIIWHFELDRFIKDSPDGRLVDEDALLDTAKKIILQDDSHLSDEDRNDEGGEIFQNMIEDRGD